MEWQKTPLKGRIFTRVIRPIDICLHEGLVDDEVRLVDSQSYVGYLTNEKRGEQRGAERLYRLFPWRQDLPALPPGAQQRDLHVLEAAPQLQLVERDTHHLSRLTRGRAEDGHRVLASLAEPISKSKWR